MNEMTPEFRQRLWELVAWGIRDRDKYDGLDVLDAEVAVYIHGLLERP